MSPEQLPLVRSDGTRLGYCLVDAEDAAWLRQWRWTLVQRYAARYEWRDGHTHCIRLHRELLGITSAGSTVLGDHINGDTLDNRRSNLRVVDSIGNAQNRRGVGRCAEPGVYWFAAGRCWGVRLMRTPGGKREFLGYFKQEADAIRVARDFRLRYLPLCRESQPQEATANGTNGTASHSVIGAHAEAASPSAD